MSFTEIINLLLGVLTVVGQIAAVGLVPLLVFGRRTKLFTFLSGRGGLFAMFAVALIATLGSLTYSEVIGYEPCKLCWIQRIFMYPQVFILGIALWRKDTAAKIYALVLSSLGALVALYHYLLQRGFAPDLGCNAVGYSVSCAKDFVMQFGYITIPLMSLTAFLLILLLSLSAVLASRTSGNLNT